MSHTLWQPPPFCQYVLMRDQSSAQKRAVLRLMRQYLGRMRTARQQAQARGEAWLNYGRN